MKCNVDDMVCQVNLIATLRQLQVVLGDSQFINRFPELEGLDSKIEANIEASRNELHETIAACSDVPIEEEEIWPSETYE